VRAALVGAALATLCVGCGHPSAYLTDRAYDLADCVTAEVGTGLGVDVAVRVTDWLVTGVGASRSEKHGFAGRYPVGPKHSNNVDAHIGFPLSTVTFPFRVGTDDEGRRLACLIALLLPDQELRHGGPDGHDEEGRHRLYRQSASILAINLAALGEKDRGRGPGTTLVDAFDVEVGATLVAVSWRVGFSFGQFADFALGWTTLDIAGDDAAAQRLRDPPPRGDREHDAEQQKP